MLWQVLEQANSPSDFTLDAKEEVPAPGEEGVAPGEEEAALEEAGPAPKEPGPAPEDAKPAPDDERGKRGSNSSTQSDAVPEDHFYKDDLR